MKKYIPLLVAAFLLSSCTNMVTHSASYYTSSMLFSSEEKSWLIQQPYQEYIQMHKDTLLSNYFPKALVNWVPPFARYNYFLANSNNNEPKIHIFITVAGVEKNKSVPYNFYNDAIRENIYFDTKWCIEKRFIGIAIAFNAPDVEFDSNFVYILKNRTKKISKEIMGNNGVLINPTLIENKKYTLSSKDTLLEKQFYTKDYRKRAPGALFPYPIFHFIFPDTTCTDLEDAVLVINNW